MLLKEKEVKFIVAKKKKKPSKLDEILEIYREQRKEEKK